MTPVLQQRLAAFLLQLARQTELEISAFDSARPDAFVFDDGLYSAAFSLGRVARDFSSMPFGTELFSRGEWDDEGCGDSYHVEQYPSLGAVFEFSCRGYEGDDNDADLTVQIFASEDETLLSKALLAKASVAASNNVQTLLHDVHCISMDYPAAMPVEAIAELILSKFPEAARLVADRLASEPAEPRPSKPKL